MFEVRVIDESDPSTYLEFLSNCFFFYTAFSHDVTAAMLVFQNKEMAAMMVYQSNLPGIEL